MAHYQVLYRIAVEHDYFNGKPCSFLQCRLSPQGAGLARQRGLLFSPSIDEWKVVYDKTAAGVDTDNDVLELELNITDPLFSLCTEWEGCRPEAAHVLDLPAAEETVDAVSAIRLSDEKRKVGMPFCTVHLRLTEEMMEMANAGKPKQTVLHFHTPEVRWEYIFFPRGDKSDSFGKLFLEDMTGKLKFSTFKDYETYGIKGWRTISKERIPIREVYENNLRLMAQKDGVQQKRILLSKVPLPEPGRFLSKEKEVIRHVGYF